MGAGPPKHCSNPGFHRCLPVTCLWWDTHLSTSYLGLCLCWLTGCQASGRQGPHLLCALEPGTWGAITKCLFPSVEQTSKPTATAQCGMSYGCYGSPWQTGSPDKASCAEWIRQDLPEEVTIWSELWRINGHCRDIIFPCCQDTFCAWVSVCLSGCCFISFAGSFSFPPNCWRALQHGSQPSYCLPLLVY